MNEIARKFAEIRRMFGRAGHEREMTRRFALLPVRVRREIKQKKRAELKTIRQQRALDTIPPQSLTEELERQQRIQSRYDAETTYLCESCGQSGVGIRREVKGHRGAMIKATLCPQCVAKLERD